jgi:hypothetical protein
MANPGTDMNMTRAIEMSSHDVSPWSTAARGDELAANATPNTKAPARGDRLSNRPTRMLKV